MYINQVDHTQLDKALENLGSSKGVSKNTEGDHSSENVWLYILLAMRETVASQTNSGLVLAKGIRDTDANEGAMNDALNNLDDLNPQVEVHCHNSVVNANSYIKAHGAHAYKEYLKKCAHEEHGKLKKVPGGFVDQHTSYTINGKSIKGTAAARDLQSVQMKNNVVDNAQQVLQQTVTEGQQRTSLSVSHIQSAVQNSFISVDQIGSFLNLMITITKKLGSL